jgi:hypothetical protein
VNVTVLLMSFGALPEQEKEKIVPAAAFAGITYVIAPRCIGPMF